MISHPHAPRCLPARERELARTGGLLTAAGEGRGGTLMAAGEPGIGKTALLRRTADDAGDVRVPRTTGLEFESAFDYAALHTLCAPLLPGLEQLPLPRRDTLRTVFGLAQGEAPNRFLVGPAVRGRLSDAAQERPLLCVVDNAQWLDRTSAQALTFVAHRVDRERIALVLAVREPDSVPEFADPPRLSLTGLPHETARTPLVSEFRAPWTNGYENASWRRHGATRWRCRNCRGWRDPAVRRAVSGFPTRCRCRAASRRVSNDGWGRCRRPPASCCWSWPSRRPGTRRRHGRQPTAWAPTVTPWPPQRLPASPPWTELCASVTPWSVPWSTGWRPPAERRRVHEVLSQVMEAGTDEDRRVWHRAQPVVRPDEEVAGDLERPASRAAARGGAATATAFPERAAELAPELAPEGETRARRALNAARAAYAAGDYDTAEHLAGRNGKGSA